MFYKGKYYALDYDIKNMVVFDSGNHIDHNANNNKNS